MESLAFPAARALQPSRGFMMPRARVLFHYYNAPSYYRLPRSCNTFHDIAKMISGDCLIEDDDIDIGHGRRDAPRAMMAHYVT